jgi:thiol-disulfide isomerase/thioredoxin
MNNVQNINERTILVGKCTLEGLISFPDFKHYYDKGYAEYDPDQSTIEVLKSLVQGLQIDVILGTWCGDSLRQVPRFLKVIDQLAIPEDNITIIAVDQTKGGSEGQVEKLHIEKVPTFVFSIDGEEVGRIVETPIETIEKDLHYLLTNE